ncbi:hypothetical protein ACFWBF_16180 [Streptomyces sp. NPDC060028]|uniref:hypothetical protein n=1 Tax=Streptomyces sp. NPDC060028 TaxID=3347041 RepID=UPI003677810E
MSQNFQPPAPSSYTEAPAAPAPARAGNIGLGLVAAVVAALVTAGIYGAIIGATKYQIGYAAVGVGFVIGFAAGKLGGRNPLLPVVGALLSLVAVLAGQILGIAMIGADELGVGTLDVLNLGVSLLFDAWKEDSDPLTFLFLAIGGYTAFQTARKIAA